MDLLFELLVMLLEILLEAFFEFAIGSLGDLVLRGVAEAFDTTELKNPLLACMGYGFFGAAAGGMSLLFFPHPLVHPSRVPGLSMIVSPVLAGLGMSLVGATLRKRNKKVTRIESFGYGFAFAFGVSIVRFLFRFLTNS